MKKILFLLCLLSPSYYSIAQNKFPFFAKNSEEFMNPKYDPDIKNVHIDNSNKLVVKRTKESEEYNVDDIWGYRNKRGKEVRIYNGEEYELLESGNLCIYAHPVLVIIMSEGYEYPVLKYYFSRRVYGDIYELNAENIEKVFALTNQKFVELMKHWKWDDELIKYDKQNHSYKIVEMYKESKKGSGS